MHLDKLTNRQLERKHEHYMEMSFHTTKLRLNKKYRRLAGLYLLIFLSRFGELKIVKSEDITTIECEIGAYLKRTDGTPMSLAEARIGTNG